MLFKKAKRSYAENYSGLGPGVASGVTGSNNKSSIPTMPNHTHGSNPYPYTGLSGGSPSVYPAPQYPNPVDLMHQTSDLPQYLNAFVKDVQSIKDLLLGLEDKLQAMQERIELLEDDIAS